MRGYKSFIAVAALFAFASAPVMADTAGVAGSTSTAASGAVNGAAAGTNAGAAADTSTSTNGSANATTSGTNAAAGAAANTTANSSASTDFGKVMTSVQGSSAGSAQIPGMTSVDSVNVIKLGDVATGDNKTTLDTAMTAHKADMAKLRTSVCSTNAIKTALFKKSIDCKNVVAANVEGGALTVYVK